MEFLIYSTSDEMDKWLSILGEKFNIRQSIDTFINYLGEEISTTHYFIQIDSVEDLLELCNNELMVLHPKGDYGTNFEEHNNYYSIEIYDDYRE